MTRLELIKRLASHYPQLELMDAEHSVKLIVKTMAQALVEGNRIEIRGFGSFGLSYRSPRVGCNPKSGKKVAVPGKYLPRFKPGTELRERVAATAIGAAAG